MGTPSRKHSEEIYYTQSHDEPHSSSITQIYRPPAKSEKLTISFYLPRTIQDPARGMQRGSPQAFSTSRTMEGDRSTQSPHRPFSDPTPSPASSDYAPTSTRASQSS